MSSFYHVGAGGGGGGGGGVGVRGLPYTSTDFRGPVGLALTPFAGPVF